MRQKCQSPSRFRKIDFPLSKYAPPHNGDIRTKKKKNRRLPRNYSRARLGDYLFWLGRHNMNMSARQLSCDPSGSRRADLAEGMRLCVSGEMLSRQALCSAVAGDATVADPLLVRTGDRRWSCPVVDGRPLDGDVISVSYIFPQLLATVANPGLSSRVAQRTGWLIYVGMCVLLPDG